MRISLTHLVIKVKTQSNRSRLKQIMSTRQHCHWLRHRLRHLRQNGSVFPILARFARSDPPLLSRIRGYKASQKPRMPHAASKASNGHIQKLVELATLSTEQTRNNKRPQAPSCITGALEHRKTQTPLGTNPRGSRVERIHSSNCQAAPNAIA